MSLCVPTEQQGKATYAQLLMFDHNWGKMNVVI